MKLTDIKDIRTLLLFVSEINANRNSEELVFTIDTGSQGGKGIFIVIGYNDFENGEYMQAFIDLTKSEIKKSIIDEIFNVGLLYNV